MRLILLLFGLMCFAPVLAQPVDSPSPDTANAREALPMSSVQGVLYLRVPVEDVGVYDYDVSVLLDGNGIMHTRGKPDENGFITQHLPRAELERIPDPHSYVIMGYNSSGDRYYTLELRGVRMWQVIATLATARARATGIQPMRYYEYETEAAKDIAVELVGERISEQDIYQAISAQTGCEITELASGTLTVSGCP